MLDRRADAVRVARAVLAPEVRAGRAATVTAIRVLCAVDVDEAGRAAAELLGRSDAALRTFALEQIDAAREAAGDRAAADRRRERRRMIAELARLVLGSSDSEARRKAALALGDLGDAIAAGPALRAAWYGDPVPDVHEAAAIALGRLGDAEMIDALVAALEARAEDDKRARAAAIALGHAGDARGVNALLGAFAAGWRPQVVGEALRSCAAVALRPLIELVEGAPHLAARKASHETIARLPADEITAVLIARLEAATADDRTRLADLYLDLARPNRDAHQAVAEAVLRLVQDAADKPTRTVRRAAARAAAPRAAEGRSDE